MAVNIFEMTAIVNRLVANDSKFFDPKDALRLKEMLLVDCGLKPKTSPTTQMSVSMTVSDDRDAGFELKSHEIEHVSCGNWDISVSVGNPWGDDVSIEHRENRMRRSHEREKYTLYYDPDGSPKNLSIMVWKTEEPWWGFGRIGKIIGTTQPYKHPSPV